MTALRGGTRRGIALVLTLLAVGPVVAQETPAATSAAIWVSYYGELGTHPGLAA